MNKNNKYKIWECKIVISADSEFPKEINGFDSVPRCSAIESIEKYNIPVLGCFSGWGGKLTKIEKEIIEE